jgi:AAA+ lid domain
VDRSVAAPLPWIGTGDHDVDGSPRRSINSSCVPPSIVRPLVMTSARPNPLVARCSWPILLPPCPGERAGIRPFLAANLASSSQGMTGADIAYLCQRVAMFCVKDAARAPVQDQTAIAVTRHHFDAALGLMTEPYATNAAHEAPSACSAASADCNATPRRTLLDAGGCHYCRLCPADPMSAPR